MRNDGHRPGCAPLMRAGVFQKAETGPVLKATCSKRLPPHYFDPFSPLICSRCLESPINYQNYLAGFRPRRRGPFVSAKGPKTISARARPLRGPFATVPNQDGSGTRCAQTALAEKSIRYGGEDAPEGGRKCLYPSFPRSLVPFTPIDQLTGTSSTTPVSHFDTFFACPLG